MTSLVAQLRAGRLPPGLLGSFPRPDPAQQAAGDEAVRKLVVLLDGCLDPRHVDHTGRLPDEFLSAVRGTDFLLLQVDPADGGMGLSDFDTFRVVMAAMRRCVAAGFALATHNGIGLPALLPVLPPGQPRELVLRRLRDGALSGWADTEPIGAANALPTTIAVPGPAGGFRLAGEKVFISNGAVADELIVSAVLPGTADAGLFLVDTRSAGFHVRAVQEVMGLKGLPLGAVGFDAVEVTPDRVLAGPGGHWRDAALLEPLSSRGRMYLLSGAALAIARRCVEFQRDFTGRRRVDGRTLGSYPAVRKLLAASLADLFAIDTTVRWSLIDAGAGLAAGHLDRVAAKNITTMACWRVVERTMSLLAAEGAETAASKARRGSPPWPVEQLFRDARMLRITGGVEYAVDLWAGESLIASHLGPAAPDPDPTPIGPARPGPDQPRLETLTAANRRHLRDLADHARRLRASGHRLARRFPDRRELMEQQTALIAAGRISGELLAMAVVLARAAGATGATASRVQQLAAVHCTAAGARLATLWRELAEPAEDPVYQLISDWWLPVDGAAGLAALLAEPAPPEPSVRGAARVGWR